MDKLTEMLKSVYKKSRDPSTDEPGGRLPDKPEKTGAVINVAVFFGVMGIIGLSLIFMERPVVSESEKRTLAEFPAFTATGFLSGEYTYELSRYYTDTVPGRDFLKDVSSNLKGLAGLPYDNVVIYHSAPLPATPETTAADIETVTSQTTPPATEPPATQSTDEPPVATEISSVETTEPPPAEPDEPDEPDDDGMVMDGNIIVAKVGGHWWGLTPFYWDNSTVYADRVNAFKEDLGDGVNVYSMVIPLSSAFYTPKNYANFYSDQKHAIDSVNNKLNGVTPIDVYSALLSKKSEDIYFRTDHHWTPLGAYYAAEEFAKAAGVPFAGLSEYTTVTAQDYVGTVYYVYTQAPELLNDPEDFIYYKPSNSYKCYSYAVDYTYQTDYALFVNQPLKESYSTFMGGDQKIVRVETDCKNGRKLAVFKDSFGNATIPCYTGSFEEIFVIDIRYFELNAVDFIKEHGVTDVLFSMCTSSAFGPNSKYIETIRTH